jgi:hypothetical protein
MGWLGRLFRSIRGWFSGPTLETETKRADDEEPQPFDPADDFSDRV